MTELQLARRFKNFITAYRKNKGVLPMKASEFAKRLADIASDCKTLYVMGCFGAPMNKSNKSRYSNNHAYNQQTKRTAMIQAATSDTFGFDCAGLIKGVLWGWTGDKAKTYGGAKYKSNNVPDAGADSMIEMCKDVSDDFGKIAVGEAVWCPGHIGVYIGNGLAVEASPAWKNKVQVTAVRNIGTKSGYPARTWAKHGKLVGVEYDVTPEPAPSHEPSGKVESAQYKDTALKGSYRVTAATGLHLRAGAGSTKDSLCVLKRGEKVRNYGFYNVADNGVTWLYVQTASGKTGFCSAQWLKKV